jgi:hypothetical protein
MPNYIPTGHDPWLDRITQGIGYLCDRRIAWVDRDFPLTHDEVQDVVMEPEPLKILRDLKTKHHIKNLPTTSRFYFTPPAHEMMPRLAEVEITCKPDMRIPDYDCSGLGVSPVANFERLPPERQQLFYTWLHTAVTERRHRNLIKARVTEFLDRALAPSLWHVMVRWPALKLGFDPNTRERAATPPRHPKQYSWDRANDAAYQWYSDNKRFMDFIDTLLLDASMLPVSSAEQTTWKTPGPWVRATVTVWQKLGEERF